MKGKNRNAFQNPVRLMFFSSLTEAIKDFDLNGRWLVICSPGAIDRGLKNLIEEVSLTSNPDFFSEVSPNPTIDQIQNLVESLSGKSYDGVVGVGGGSVLDTAKVASMCLRYGMTDVRALLENVSNLSIKTKELETILIPTTAGSGAEVTPFSTVWDPIEKRKLSIDDSRLYASAAAYVPELTLSTPYEQTLFSGLDAISHALESIWNKNRTALTMEFSLRSLEIFNEFMPFALADLSNAKAREKLQIASLFSGLAISGTRTAVAHSISYPITMHHGVPHGLACSFMLPELIDLYIAENPKDENIQLFNEIKDFLLSLRLRDLISNYVTKNDMVKLLPNMKDPKRYRNYSIESLNDVNFLQLIVNE